MPPSPSPPTPPSLITKSVTNINQPSSCSSTVTNSVAVIVEYNTPSYPMNKSENVARSFVNPPINNMNLVTASETPEKKKEYQVKPTPPSQTIKSSYNGNIHLRKVFNNLENELNDLEKSELETMQSSSPHVQSNFFPLSFYLWLLNLVLFSFFVL